MKRSLDRLLKFRHLRMVEALVRFQSLTRAASHLGLTQPALTKAIRELEELIGEPLFDRHARGVRPTEAGLRLEAFARRSLVELSRLEASLDHVDADAVTPVTIGALPVAAVGLLPAVLQRVRTDQPHLRLRVVEGRTEDLLSKLDAGEVDLVVGRLYGPDAPDGLKRETLYAEPISIIARVGHPLHRIRRPTVRDLAEQDLVLPEFSQRIAHDIARYMENIGLSATPNSIRSTSRGFIREMVLGTDMITVMPRMVMGGDLLRGQVRVVPVAAPAMPRPAGVITNPRLGESPAARALVGVIRTTIAELAASGDVDITR